MKQSDEYKSNLISVIIPYDFDRGWLEDAIKSVEAQTYKNWEIVRASGFGSCSANMNFGLEAAQGEYVKKLDEDDMLTPNCLQDLYDGIQGYDWVCADAINTYWFNNRWMDEHNQGEKATLKGMLRGNKIHGGSTMYRHEIVGLYDEDLPTAEEYDLHLRLLHEGRKLNYVPKTVYIYRVHGSNKSGAGPATRMGSSGLRRQDIIDKIRQRYV